MALRATLAGISAMYESHDPLASFAADYNIPTEPPAKGSLDLRQVLASPYFFS